MYKKKVFFIFLFAVLSLTAPLIINRGIVTASSSTTVYISPPTIMANVGQTITVYIFVSSVSDLWGWQAGMTFNPNVLECRSFEESPFLQQGGTTFYVEGIIDNTNGIISFSHCVLKSPTSSHVSGSGNLAKVEFRCKNIGDSDLGLTDVILISYFLFTPREIARDITNGTVHVSAAVGGAEIPVDKIGMLAPYISLASTILVAVAATTIYIKHVRGKKKQ